MGHNHLLAANAALIKSVVHNKIAAIENTSWQQAHENLADIEDEFTKQIAQKKLTDAVEFKKDAAKSKGLIDNGPSKNYDNKQIRK